MADSTALPQAPFFDEMVDGRGGLRPQWRGVLAAFASLGVQELDARARRLDRAFAEEGIATALPSDPGRPPAPTPWRCDPVPLPIPAGEWARLEEGLTQRADLLAAILADLYGPQRLLSEGLLPSALVHPNAGFLRGCRHLAHSVGPGSANAASGGLTFYAADLVRAPGGQWHVLADRTGAAHGIGFARENRRMLSRVMPEAFRAVQVRQLRPFFEAWEEYARRLAPPARSNPRVVILGQGTHDPFWVEHLFLARELSATLVEGTDLTARGDKLFLKTLRGLQPVDVVLRRMPGAAIDPLEFDAQSPNGVAGLMHVVRQGGVAVANDPGTGLAEAPALAAFLPAIAERLLGTRLLLPSVPTAWLGHAHALEALRQGPAKYLLRPATEGTRPATRLDDMGDAALAATLARVAERPWAWAATDAVPPSGAPSVAAGGLAPKPVVLRSFLCRGPGGGWIVLPGGLARIIDDADRVAGRLPRGGVSKDVWVLAEDGLDLHGPAHGPAPALQVRRQPADLPSRLLDNLYWLGRYVERLEEGARLLRAALTRLTRAWMLPRDHAQLRALAHCLADAQFIDEEAAQAPPGTAALAQALQHCVRADRPMLTLFDEIERLAGTVRDRITADMWAGLTTELGHAREKVREAWIGADALLDATAGVIRFSTYIAGMAAENMVRGGARLFLDLGRRVERASAIARDIAHALDGPPQRMEAGLALALELADSQITYRTRYLAILQPLPVLDLVLADPANPRGLAFQFGAIAEALSEAAQDRGDALAIDARTLAAVAASAAAEIPAGQDGVAAAVRLPDTLHRIAARAGALSDAVARKYFSHVPPAQSVGFGQGEMASEEAAA
jgi:uncharacterized circularly permuted ATP-grasp superfamily protein/uncharacterized alpha-E superfamily protein